MMMFVHLIKIYLFFEFIDHLVLCCLTGLALREQANTLQGQPFYWFLQKFWKNVSLPHFSCQHLDGNYGGGVMWNIYLGMCTCTWGKISIRNLLSDCHKIQSSKGVKWYNASCFFYKFQLKDQKNYSEEIIIWVETCENWSSVCCLRKETL